MKDIDTKDAPDAAGGRRLDDGGCIPTPIIELPPGPIVPLPEIVPDDITQF